jgi:hypothetical protein
MASSKHEMMKQVQEIESKRRQFHIYPPHSLPPHPTQWLTVFQQWLYPSGNFWVVPIFMDPASSGQAPYNIIYPFCSFKTGVGNGCCGIRL